MVKYDAGEDTSIKRKSEKAEVTESPAAKKVKKEKKVKQEPKEEEVTMDADTTVEGDDTPSKPKKVNTWYAWSYIWDY